MIKKTLWTLIVISILIPINAQQQFFKVKTLDLKVIRYPWANEFSLSVDIITKKILVDAKLQIAIKYIDKNVASYSAVVKKTDRYYQAKKTWEPLNQPAQEALLGKYSVKIEMIVKNQNPDFIKRWQKFSSASRITIITKAFSIGNESQTQKQQEETKEFYIERMKNLNALYSKLKKREVVAYRNKNFKRKKWLQWLYNEYLQKINNEKKLLDIRQKRVYRPRYKYTMNGMKYYCDLLVRIGKTSTQVLYKRHRLRPDNASTRGIDPFSIKSRKSLNKIIESIHRSSAREMNISLRQKLGYIPPPK
ncbi:hypothetical protein [Candidatus Uabimicrobium sp. HlEnr_7]|uniref:hypothetical protein n=1 Tax=Candidatus Uabimicrobium helgolandensis TaxID=3095367 RepID=UPI003557323F